MPYFTICIPVYNREKTIKKTLISLVSQTFQDFEVLIIDDGSNDTSAQEINHVIKKMIWLKNTIIFLKKMVVNIQH